jgi:hypothetical protein
VFFSFLRIYPVSCCFLCLLLSVCFVTKPTWASTEFACSPPQINTCIIQSCACSYIKFSKKKEELHQNITSVRAVNVIPHEQMNWNHRRWKRKRRGRWTEIIGDGKGKEEGAKEKALWRHCRTFLFIYLNIRIVWHAFSFQALSIGGEEHALSPPGNRRQIWILYFGDACRFWLYILDSQMQKRGTNHPRTHCSRTSDSLHM